MKAVSGNVKKHIKRSIIYFVMYLTSVLANTKDQSLFLGVLNRFFTLLISSTKTEMVEHAVSFLEEKIKNIEHENTCLIIDENKNSLSGNKVFLETHYTLHLTERISITLIMGGNPFYFHGSSLVVKLLP